MCACCFSLHTLVLYKKLQFVMLSLLPGYLWWWDSVLSATPGKSLCSLPVLWRCREERAQTTGWQLGAATKCVRIQRVLIFGSKFCGTWGLWHRVHVSLIAGFIFSLFLSGRNSILSFVKVTVRCTVCVLFLICGLCYFVLGYAKRVEIVCVIHVRRILG